MNIDVFSALGADRLVESIGTIFDATNSLIPASIENIVVLFIVLSVFLLGMGFVLRLFFGNRCAVNRGISGFMSVFFIYTATTVVYSLRPWNLTDYLAPLPYAIFRTDILIICTTSFSDLPLLCAQLLSLIILCFIVHLSNYLLPNVRSFFLWLLMRILSLALAVALFLGANWGINTFFPSVLAQSAPVVLVAVLGATLLVSLFNPLLCILFTAANPVIGLLYTFFFSNTIGKNLTRAVISAAMVYALFYAVETFGFSVIDITPGALLCFSPFAAVLIGIWYVFDAKL